MAARSPARFLAPLALLAFALALVLVVTRSSTDGGSSATPANSGEEQPAATPGAGTGGSGRRGPRFYRVRAGDTPSAIAERTGVPLGRIQELNPNLDPQTLAPGQRIRLRR